MDLATDRAHERPMALRVISDGRALCEGVVRTRRGAGSRYSNAVRVRKHYRLFHGTIVPTPQTAPVRLCYVGRLSVGLRSLSPMAVAALIIAIFSALAAGLAAGLSYWIHKQEGSLVSCKWQNSVVLSDPPQQFLKVRAINSGRSATTIAGYGVEWRPYKGKKGRRHAWRWPPVELDPSLELKADSSEEWQIPWEPILNANVTIENGSISSLSLYAYVLTGADRMVYAEEAVPREAMYESED